MQPQCSWTPHYCSTELLTTPLFLLYSIIPVDRKQIIIPGVSRKQQRERVRGGGREKTTGGGGEGVAQVTAHFHRGQTETVQLSNFQ